DHELFAPQQFPVHPDVVLILKRGHASKQGDAFFTVTLLRGRRSRLANDVLLAGHHPVPVEIDRAWTHAKLVAALQQRIDFRGAEQGFGGHASVVRTVAAHLVFLDDRDGMPPGARPTGGTATRRATADDDEVESPVGFPHPRHRSSLVQSRRDGCTTRSWGPSPRN